MAEYIEIDHAKTLSGLRTVLPPGRPNPWGEALKASELIAERQPELYVFRACLCP